MSSNTKVYLYKDERDSGGDLAVWDMTLAEFCDEFMAYNIGGADSVIECACVFSTEKHRDKDLAQYMVDNHA